MAQNKVNYQRELEKLLDQYSREGRVPTLFLHSCCAPCSSYVLEYLAQYFAITVFYYNPNIYPEEEYRKRVQEQQQLIGELNLQTGYNRILFVEGTYDPAEYFEAVRGLEQIPEGGERCFACFRLRLGSVAREAAVRGFDYVTTTLTISPLKDAQKLNEIGREAAEAYGVQWLPSDFKKRNGYQRSIGLSRQYGLYRQDYCGCVFSRKEREQMKV